MRTTLNVSDPIMRRLKETAVRQHRSMSEIVESALCAVLDKDDAGSDAEMPPLPSFHMGTPCVDIADRNALYEAMDRS